MTKPKAKKPVKRVRKAKKPLGKVCDNGELDTLGIASKGNVKPTFCVGQKWLLKNGKQTIIEHIGDDYALCCFNYAYTKDGKCVGYPERDLVKLVEDTQEGVASQLKGARIYQYPDKEWLSLYFKRTWDKTEEYCCLVNNNNAIRIRITWAILTVIMVIQIISLT